MIDGREKNGKEEEDGWRGWFCMRRRRNR